MTKHKAKKQTGKQAAPIRDKETEPDWTTPCENCNAVPTLPITGLCGPCTFGEAETEGGNW